MHTRDLPQGIVGFQFATALLRHDFEAAQGLLSPELRLEYPVARLEQRFVEMMSLAEEPPEADAVEVLDNSGLGRADLNAEGWAYVAIWSEAVTVTVQRFGADYRITELFWGRP
jgi:hypothetical protein